jgi:hypothetical protein
MRGGRLPNDMRSSSDFYARYFYPDSELMPTAKGKAGGKASVFCAVSHVQ